MVQSLQRKDCDNKVSHTEETQLIDNCIQVYAWLFNTYTLMQAQMINKEHRLEKTL